MMTRKKQLEQKIAKYNDLRKSTHQLMMQAQDYRTAISREQLRQRNHRLIVTGLALERYIGGPVTRQDIRNMVSIAIQAGWHRSDGTQSDSTKQSS